MRRVIGRRGGAALVTALLCASVATPAQASSSAVLTTRPASIGLGPAGGYTPDDLAAAYGYSATRPASGQLLAVVAPGDDPKVLADLDTFDAEYALPAETPTSFRRVDQNGAASPRPQASAEAARSISLDVEVARGTCRTCRLLLVEARTSSDVDLAAAEDRAVALGATVIDNVISEPEQSVSSGVRSAYHHPGVVIVAPAGDHGWHGWELANSEGGQSRDLESFPASDPDVVAVGGTSLGISNDGSRYAEVVWNDNGMDDQTGIANGAQGATGGGCSTVSAAPAWQTAAAGYAAAGCHGKRLTVDIAADADPATGVDVYDSYDHSGWTTRGGTSLAATIVAGMFALAGGAHGSAYPAATLYANSRRNAAAVYDVVSGGNAFCGGDSTLNCGNAAYAVAGKTHNPNALGVGNVDCSFPRDDDDVPAPPPLSSECNAVTGLDGASGLGAPASIAMFAATAPTVTLTRPRSLRLEHAATFRATAKESVSGAQVTGYAWSWGDGTSSKSPSGHVAHTYKRAGTHTITLTVTDSLHQVVVRTARMTVGVHASVRLTGPATLTHGRSRAYAATARTPNTGATVSRVAWRWGDGQTSTGTHVHHAWSRPGTYTVIVTVADSTGVVTTTRKRVTVT